VLALLELQGMDEADVLSYFQIMGAERLVLNDTAWVLAPVVNLDHRHTRAPFPGME
jgi:hypothetical protein